MDGTWKQRKKRNGRMMSKRERLGMQRGRKLSQTSGLALAWKNGLRVGRILKIKDRKTHQTNISFQSSLKKNCIQTEISHTHDNMQLTYNTHWSLHKQTSYYYDECSNTIVHWGGHCQNEVPIHNPKWLLHRHHTNVYLLCTQVRFTMDVTYLIYNMP